MTRQEYIDQIEDRGVIISRGHHVGGGFYKYCAHDVEGNYKCLVLLREDGDELEVFIEPKQNTVLGDAKLILGDL